MVGRGHSKLETARKIKKSCFLNMSTINEIMPASIAKSKRPIQKKGFFPCQDISTQAQSQ